MKTLPTLTILTALLTVPLSADLQEDIQLGIEAVTGFRSNYIYRGFELSESTLDFQLEAEISLNDYTFLNVGTWYATETGDGDFDEAAFFTHLRFEQSDHLTIGLSATYRTFSHSTPPLSADFEDGLDLGAFGIWQFCRDFGTTFGIYYDTGADGWYAHLETLWTKPISDKAFISLKTGISYVDDYYRRDGLNDAYSRLTLTYNISDTVSVTPFIGASVLLDNDDAGDNQAFGGIWFEVRF